MSKYTKLSVSNHTPNSVSVYVSFSNIQGNCNVENFPVLTPVAGKEKLMGTFNLASGSTQEFAPKGYFLSGNICFFVEPRCPIMGADFFNGGDGTNIAQFSLNTPDQKDEDFSISCINGVNTIMEMKVDENDHWMCNNNSITSIANKGVYENKGNMGVFPVNCSGCTTTDDPKACTSLESGEPQDNDICKVIRQSNNANGGTVQVILKPEIPLNTAKEWIKNWKANNLTAKTKAVVIPTRDLANLLIELEVFKVQPGGSYQLNLSKEGVMNVRGYFANDGSEDKLLLVGTEQFEGNYADIISDDIYINKSGATQKANNTVSNGTSGIYDLTTPCPPMCDPNSPLNNQK